MKKKKSSNAGGAPSAAAAAAAGDDAKHEAKLQAVILADPFSDVFKPLSFDRCAPMLCPLNNVILLDYTMDFCAGAGVEELIVVCVQEQVEAHVKKWQENNNSGSRMQVTVVRDGSLTNAGDALRELDKRNLVQSDPFLLLHGDVVTNVDLKAALREHKERHKADSSAIMTLLFKEVSPWNATEEEDEATGKRKSRATYSTLRASTEDLVVGLDTSSTNIPGNAPRIFVYDDRPQQATVHLPCSFLTACPSLDFRCDLLDCGIDICSPDVLARFSDEFDYRDIRREFVANSVAEEEEGLQSKLYAHVLQNGEYAARVRDWRTYAAVSHDLLRRWCYPIVPDNLPSGYEKQFRYVQQQARQYVYREQKLGRTKVGRSSVVKGGGMIGSHCFIGENCTIQGTVIGNHVHIADNVTLIDCHVWDGVCIEQDATCKSSILAYECVIKEGATVPKGSVIGEGCIIGTSVKLPTFSRITTVSKDAEESDDDDFDDFDDDSEEEEDDDEEENKGEEAGSSGGGDATKTAGSKGEDEDDEVETDHQIVGKDGRGRVWLPSVDDDDDSDSDDEEDNEQTALLEKLKEMKSRSIGFDPTNLYLERKKQQEGDLEDDCFSDDEMDNDGMGGMDDDFGDDTGAVAFGDAGGATSSTMMAGASEIPTYGRQAGVDVVKELKTICLEFEPSSPMENLAIELNSYKFSQNATYSDCVMGASLAVLELMKIAEGMSDGKLVGALKAQLEVWLPLLKRLCIGVEEEKAVIVAFENSAIGGGEMGEVLSKGMSFRFVLQTLHDEEAISEESILTWASERRTEVAKGGDDNPRIQLFQMQPIQDFLEWLEDDSEEAGSEEDESEEE